MAGRSDLVDIDVVVRQTTDKAYGVEDPFAKSPRAPLIWVPKSMCEVEYGGGPSNAATMTLSESFAQMKGLI